MKTVYPFRQFLRLFDKLNQEEKIALKNKLEGEVEGKFTNALKTIWKKNKNVSFGQVKEDVREAVTMAKKSGAKSRS